MTFSYMHSGLLGDSALEDLFSDACNIQHMLVFEAAMAQAQASHGIIPQSAADRISDVASDLVIEPADLVAATTQDSVPIPEFVRRLREATGPEAGAFVHWGATSQDVTDTSLVLRIRKALDIIEQRLIGLASQLADMAEAHRATIMVGRTRNMQAAPLTFGGKVAAWLSAALRHIERLRELRPRIETLSFAGAVGTLSVFGDKADSVADALAKELALARSDIAWHTQRDRIVELAGLCANITGSLGKIGSDCANLASSEVAEIVIKGGGGSSTMPNKANPVAAEVLITLARFNASSISAVYQAAIQEHERGGSGWALEWMTLPQIIVSCGASLRTAQSLIDAIDVRVDQMRKNIDASLGLPYAEAASFMLAQQMPRQEAQALLKQACQRALEEQRHLREVLAEQAPQLMDVQEQLFRDDWIVASTSSAIDRMLDKVSRLKPKTD
ncbi:MAG: 3-carboxy-cis,cis-muconate cycloisomerase [Pseudomonadota bacterium]